VEIPFLPNSMSIREAALLQGVTSGTVRRWLLLGLAHGGRVVRLNSTKIGGRYRITRNDLIAFIQTINTRY
jgi:excisionase family DNA binding protein